MSGFTYSLSFAVVGAVAVKLFVSSPLLKLSRGIDYLRAAVMCAEVVWRVARDAWGRNWGECLHRARRER